jgi:hypothetical protein
MFPKYKVKPMCAHPSCSKFVDHVHHVVRRSFIGGDVAWVKYDGKYIVGNLVGLCWKHHEEITLNQKVITWDKNHQDLVWCRIRSDGDLEYEGTLFPQPPIHGHAHEEETGEPAIIGPGSTNICPGCHRPVPKKKEPGEKKEEAKRRKSWNVTVPADTEEDGALVLDTLLEECAALFGRDMSEPNLRYFVLAQALALVVQNGHLLS